MAMETVKLRTILSMVAAVCCIQIFLIQWITTHSFTSPSPSPSPSPTTTPSPHLAKILSQLQESSNNLAELQRHTSPPSPPPPPPEIGYPVYGFPDYKGKYPVELKRLQFEWKRWKDRRRVGESPAFDIQMTWLLGPEGENQLRMEGSPWEIMFAIFGPDFEAYNRRSRSFIESKPWYDPHACAGNTDPLDAMAIPSWDPALVRAAIHDTLASVNEPEGNVRDALANDFADYVILHACMTGSMPDPDRDALCDPDWIENPKFLVLACEEGEDYQCGGLGDRMSAMVTATLAGMLSGRAVIFGTSRPAPLSSVFIPHMIAWDASPCIDPKHGDYVVHPLYMINMIHPTTYGPPEWWPGHLTSWSSNSAEVWRMYPPENVFTLHPNGSEPVAYIFSNTWPDRLQHSTYQHPFKPWLDASHMLMEYDAIHLHKVFHALLIKDYAPPLAARIENAQTALYAPLQDSAVIPTLLGLHIRIGDAAFLGQEMDMGHVHDVIDRVLVEAAKTESALDLDPDTTRWLILTDTPLVKDIVRDRLGSKCIFSPIVAGHIDKGTPKARLAAFHDVFVDIALLASTRCIIGPLSGFSRTAASLSSRPKTCIRILYRSY